ncbi:unnamed protein product [Linum trigynum]|uniref:K Homology domain-containing protein n=1 Tax=Linum trigynum TaxID=586398 RepID=A0AAV2G567_9ROSI
MDGNKRKSFDKQQNKQFQNNGPNKKVKWNNPNGKSPVTSQPSDTVYRILCPAKKIGGVIGKGGSIIKALREETQAKITVPVASPSLDERVIIIYSSPEKVSRKESNGEESSAEKNELGTLVPHCAAQDALLKVHKCIVEDDHIGGMASGDVNESNVVSARLLVPNNMVGCILGKGGDVIKRLRSETGASIRVLPPEQLPTCAMSTDELVQISGKLDVAKRALYEVSTLLHQNPRKDKSVGGPVPFGGQTFYPPQGPMLPPENSLWPHRNSSHSMPPLPWVEGDVPPRHGDEPSAEFSMKILCSVGKIGGVIGKGGSNVKLIQQETGASIHVEDALSELDERAIRVSAFEALRNPRSQTIEAILQLQSKTSEFSEKGTITTKLLVPSNKVGCILGQGGQVINEMRKRTQADIRVYSKDDKPKCASDDEELIQISGNTSVAEDALAEIASRLRARTLRDTNGGEDHRPVGPNLGFGPGRNMPGRRPFPSGSIGDVGSSGYEPVIRAGIREHELQNYPIPPRYSHGHNGFDPSISSNGAYSEAYNRRNHVSNVNEVSGGRMTLPDIQFGGSGTFVETRMSSDHRLAAPTHGGIGQHPYMTTAGPDMNARQGNNFQQSSYPNSHSHSQQFADANPRTTFSNYNAQPSGYHQNYNNAPQSAHHHPIGQPQSPYKMIALQGNGYSNFSTPQGANYHNGTQQGAYQY